MSNYNQNSNGNNNILNQGITMNGGNFSQVQHNSQFSSSEFDLEQLKKLIINCQNELNSKDENSNTDENKLKIELELLKKEVGTLINSDKKDDPESKKNMFQKVLDAITNFNTLYAGLPALLSIYEFLKPIVVQ